MTKKLSRKTDWDQYLNKVFENPKLNNSSIFCYESVGSTMDVAKDLIKNQEIENSGLVLAEKQTKGRGRRGNTWEEGESSLYMTAVFSTIKEINEISAFSLVAGICVANALDEFNCQTKLKWPNDVLSLENKKIAGVLIETFSIDKKNYLLVGIGVNLKKTRKVTESYSCVYSETKKLINPVEVVLKLYPLLMEDYNEFYTQGFSIFVKKWLRRSWIQKQEIELEISEGNRIKGGYAGINAKGALLLEVDGQIMTIMNAYNIVY